MQLNLLYHVKSTCIHNVRLPTRLQSIDISYMKLNLLYQVTLTCINNVRLPSRLQSIDSSYMKLNLLYHVKSTCIHNVRLPNRLQSYMQLNLLYTIHWHVNILSNYLAITSQVTVKLTSIHSSGYHANLYLLEIFILLVSSFSLLLS